MVAPSVEKRYAAAGSVSHAVSNAAGAGAGAATGARDGVARERVVSGDSGAAAVVRVESAPGRRAGGRFRKKDGTTSTAIIKPTATRKRRSIATAQGTGS